MDAVTLALAKKFTNEKVPFGETTGTVEVLGETEITGLSGEDVAVTYITVPLSLSVGKCTVMYKGAAYECTATEQQLNGMSFVVLGNLKVMGMEDSGEPFGVAALSAEDAAQAGFYGQFVVYDGSTSVTLSITQEQTVITPLPVKYLHPSVPWVAEEDGGLTEILAETVTLDEDGSGTLSTIPSLVAGETYTIAYGGAEYSCVCQDLSELQGAECYGLGNFSMAGLDDTGEPFVLMTLPSNNVAGFFVLDGTVSADVEFALYQSGGATVNKLDNRCLDLAWLPTTEEVATDILPETTQTPNSSDRVQFTGTLGLVVGKTYTVNWNSVDYECVAVSPADGTIVLGDFSAAGSTFPATGHPFGVAELSTANTYIILTNDGSSEITVSIKGFVTVPNKMPEEFLPDDFSVSMDSMAGEWTLNTESEPLTLNTQKVFSGYASYVTGLLANGALKVTFYYSRTLSNGTTETTSKTMYLMDTGDGGAFGMFEDYSAGLMIAACVRMGAGAAFFRLVPMRTTKHGATGVSAATYPSPVLFANSQMYALTVDDTGAVISVAL